MQVPKVDKRLQNSISIVILCVIIIFGVFFGVIKPQAQNLKNVNIDLAAKERELSAKEDKVKDLKKIEKELPDIKIQSDILIKALPSKADLPGLLVQIEAIAARLGIELSGTGFTLPSASDSGVAAQPSQTQNLGIEPTDEVTASPISTYETKEMNFPFTMSGNYSRIIEFLNVLQNNLRIFKINSITIDAPGGEATAFSISVSITTYYIEKGIQATTTKEEGEL